MPHVKHYNMILSKVVTSTKINFGFIYDFIFIVEILKKIIPRSPHFDKLKVRKVDIVTNILKL